jgi:hypothetical protein
VAQRFNRVRKRIGYRTFAPVLTLRRIIEHVFTAPDDVDHAREQLALAQRVMNRECLRAQTVANHANYVHEVGADAVHLVDERHARHAIPVGLTPNGFRLRLDATHRAEYSHRAVEHAQRTLDFNREVDVSGRIDDVNAVVLVEALPMRRRRGRRNRDAAFLLLLHPVHGRSAFMHLADAMNAARVVQDAFGRRRLAGIDVSHDADIAELLKRCGPGHFYFDYQR